MSDDPGVMGNLPRSRPGRRSDKRSAATRGGGGAKPGRAPQRPAKARSKTASAKSKTASARSTGSRARSSAPSSPRRAPDPVGDAVRAATKVAGAGIGLAVGVLKRLPRP